MRSTFEVLKSILGGLLCLTLGCSHQPPVPTLPIEVEVYESPLGPSKNLMIFFPGRGDHHSAFHKRGFINTFHDSGIHADLMTVNLHLGYYQEPGLAQLIHTEVIQPKIEAGYQSIWITGISLGGLGAFIYAKSYPSNVKGIIAIAPFLPDDGLYGEIQQSGGLKDWHVSSTSLYDERNVSLWQWLQEYSVHPNDLPDIYMLSGQQDLFIQGQSLVADVLPGEQVLFMNGKHRWKIWQKLWSRFISQNETLYQ